MKFRRAILLLFLAAFITAWLTRPGAADFEAYRESRFKKETTAPIIESSNGFIFSIFTISHFETRTIPTKKSDGTDTTATIAIPREKENYLGLFGKFWKVN